MIKKSLQTCSAVMLLISQLLRIKMSQDIMYVIYIENAGGKFHDKPCVVDENITSPHYKYVGEWMKGLIENKLIYIFTKVL